MLWCLKENGRLLIRLRRIPRTEIPRASERSEDPPKEDGIRVLVAEPDYFRHPFGWRLLLVERVAVNPARRGIRVLVAEPDIFTPPVWVAFSFYAVLDIHID